MIVCKNDGDIVCSGIEWMTSGPSRRQKGKDPEMNDVQIVREGAATPSTEIVTCSVCEREGLKGDFPGQGGIVPDGSGDLVCDACAANQEGLLVGEGPSSEDATESENEMETTLIEGVRAGESGLSEFGASEFNRILVEQMEAVFDLNFRAIPGGEADDEWNRLLRGNGGYRSNLNEDEREVYNEWIANLWATDDPAWWASDETESEA